MAPDLRQEASGRTESLEHGMGLLGVNLGRLAARGEGTTPASGYWAGVFWSGAKLQRRVPPGAGTSVGLLLKTGT